MIELLSNAGFIMYSKKAARLFGVNGAILLGELCAKYQYWLDNGGLLENEGWFFCTREDIEADTMLSSFQQREAMRALTENAVLGTKLMGMPSRTYYRINADVLYTMMSRNLMPRRQETSQHDVKKLDTTKKETKKETKNLLPPIPPAHELFERFWSAYPKKVAKPVAEKAFQKLNPSAELGERILSDIELRKTSKDWTKDGGQYIPNPSTYLNQRRWEDEIQLPRKKETSMDLDGYEEWASNYVPVYERGEGV